MAAFPSSLDNETCTFESPFDVPEFEDNINIQNDDKSVLVETRKGIVIKSTEEDEETISGLPCKLKLPDFPVDRPWLPQKALKIIEKIKKGPISESELASLMKMVQDESSNHFQLESGKYVASTFLGRIIEVADNRITLLKKIQSRTSDEEIFVWRVGFETFGGRT